MTSDHNRVVVDWRAEADDVLLLGIELELIDPTELDWSWGGPQAPDGRGDQPLLPPSESLEAYLLDQIRVSQDGVACQGEMEPFTDFVEGGAVTIHTCPQPVKAVELEIRMLHDINDAYRTFARSGGTAQPRQAVFTITAPRHTWTFGVEAAHDAHGAAWFQIIAAAGLGTVIAGLTIHIRRRRHRRGDGHSSLQGNGRYQEASRIGTHAIAPVALLAAVEPQPFGWLEGDFVRLIDMERGGLLVGTLAVVTAFGIGAAHALAPGHGKGLMSAYLVGTRGRASDALALGAIVAVMHCVSVLVLGGVLFTTVSLQANVGEVMPWMALSAGLLVATVGGGLVARQTRIRTKRLIVTGAISHGHEHHHSHEHPHDLPEGVRPFSRRGLVALGVSGGLLPSPSAFLVMATAILMGRALFGFMLVVVFSLGLATTLTAFGLTAIKGRALLERGAAKSHNLRRFTAILPLVSSVAVLLGGLWIITMTLVRL